MSQSTLADLTEGPLAGLGVTDGGQKLRAIPPSGTGEIVSALELVALGAVYEDKPDSDFRFGRHFFDPQQGGKGLLNFLSSREWVLEADGDIPEQQFSLRDAHDFYLEALTRGDKPTRERNLTLLLHTIGRAVHHLQDMSQPAHVRDDAHPLGADGDTYEAYTDTQFVDNNRPLPGPLPCAEAAIDLRVFDTAAKFWSNEDRGIAEFTAHNFVSQDSNFRVVGNQSASDPTHPLPSFPSSPVFESITLQELDVMGPTTATMQFLGLPISDAASNGGCFNPRAVARSSLFGIDAMPLYSLNSFTWEANYPILFPRAIAYSVGLIDYFFRGKLRLESYSATGNSVQIIIRNISDAEFALAEIPGASGAEFSVYYDTQNGMRHRLSLQGDDLAGGALAYGETATLSFGLPSNVATDVEKPFVLIFDGKIGNERGIAAIPIGPQTGAFLVTPNYAPADGTVGARVLTQSEGSWQVSAQADAVAGNMDWRGHHPDDVLTWDGPSSRYFNSGVTGSSPNIYRGGRVLSVAPGPVIGAAVTVRGAPRYLIVAVRTGSGATIYRRPYQLSYKKDGLYDLLNNPLGWRAIHSFDSALGSHMFFNASGTEGQVFSSNYSDRFKVSISGDNVSQSRISNDGSFRLRHEQSATPHVSVDVQPGPQAYCRSERRDCTGGRGQCTNPNGSVSDDVCLVEHSQEDLTYGRTTSNIFSYENIQGAVVCADYLGDVEMLCTVEIEEDTGGETSVFSGEERYDNLWILDQSTCGSNTGGSKSFRTRHQNQYDSRQLQILRVGSRSIPLSGSTTLTRKDYSTDLSWSSGPMPQRMVDYTYEQAYQRYDSRVLYADARYDIIAYENHVNGLSISGTGSTDVKTRNDGTFFISLNAMQTTRRESKVVLLADREHVISTHSEVTQPQLTEIGGEEPYDLRPSQYECSVDGPMSYQEESTIELRNESFFRDAIHPRVYQPGDQLSISALAQGNFVASVPIWVRQANNSYVQEGTWYHLTGGSLPALLPPSSSPASPSFAPTGIVK